MTGYREIIICEHSSTFANQFLSSGDFQHSQPSSQIPNDCFFSFVHVYLKFTLHINYSVYNLKLETDLKTLDVLREELTVKGL